VADLAGQTLAEGILHVPVHEKDAVIQKIGDVDVGIDAVENGDQLLMRLRNGGFGLFPQGDVPIVSDDVHGMTVRVPGDGHGIAEPPIAPVPAAHPVFQQRRRSGISRSGLQPLQVRSVTGSVFGMDQVLDTVVDHGLKFFDAVTKDAAEGIADIGIAPGANASSIKDVPGMVKDLLQADPAVTIIPPIGDDVGEVSGVG
jgi:hypothetical protein